MRKEYEETLTNIIKKHLPNCKIYLFGSRAKKTHDPASDIDIAVDNSSPVAKIILANMREDLEESTIPFCVDLLDLQTVSEDLKEEILKDKVEWKK